MGTASKKKLLRVACLQVNAGLDWKKNIGRVKNRLKAAAKQRVKLAALPEMFYWRGPNADLGKMASEVTPQVITDFKRLARDLGMGILLGSLLEKSPHRGLFYNTSFLLSGSGKVTAKYRKIHLFDIFMRGKVSTQESRHIKPGREIVTGRIEGLCVGLSICYDLRFPELFRNLSGKGARLVFVPANFAYTTGKAHWEALLKARAIENQVFVIAPGQAGIHPGNKIRSFGNSLIIDPWGTVLKRGTLDREGMLIADLDLARQRKLRSQFPVLSHRRVS